ncbi:hypothetical protein [Sphingomicrobium aestuariivivum]|uniref:hypothetical protein n=1 Tax=Sphingomicrobium aestuariivivum TaxID=1582356 RepID=UPI001FD66277|nr:hypothetical protein [Sphingomicrobium aestuariivivum]MCJ8191856.1 hypothetical protein [Sphingomicrobium aestuariivivum]
MDFYKLIKSLDDLVYEVLSWLYFYPRTLLRVIFKPFGLMKDTHEQMLEDDDPAFGDRIAPPLFLAITLVLIHVVELAIDPKGGEVEYSNPVVANFMADDKNLLAFRIVLYGILPLIAAARQLTYQGVAIRKSSLKNPFYPQCYAAAGFTVLTSLAIFGTQAAIGNEEGIRAVFWLFGGILLSFVWLGFVEARWFHRVVETSRVKALGHALMVLGMWSALALTLTILIA